MVGIAMDCLKNPLGAVQTMFDKARAEGASLEQLSRSDWGVKDLFQAFLSQEGMIWKVPDISSMDGQLVPQHSLVRFRGMVQDMFDAEYYVGAYKDGERWFTNKYSDCASVQVDVQCDNKIWDRRIYYCVPVPGQNTWMTQAIAFNPEMMRMCGVSHLEKRARETSTTSSFDDMDEDAAFSSESQEEKRLRVGNTHREPFAIDDAQHTSNINIPSGEFESRSCLVKIYDGGDEDIKLNDVVEFIGVLTYDPDRFSITLMQHGTSENLFSQLSTTLLDEDLSVLISASNYVPRLHCIVMRKLSGCHLLSTLPCLEDAMRVCKQNISMVREARESLLQGLSRLLGGDSLAAEYLLLHLLSKVHARVDPMAIGKLSLNFIGCYEEKYFAQNLAENIAALLPSSQFISLSLENLNKALFSPKKNYQCNRLMTGALQLAEGTHLTLDETALKAGQLNAVGVQNVQSLKNLMEWQKVEYDFEFHKLEIPTDVPVLVVSHTKSKLFPADTVVPLRCTENQSGFTHGETELKKWRSFLSLVRELDHVIDPQMQKILENDLVAARQEDRSINSDTFHRWLTMARLISCSFGDRYLTIEHWQRVKELENRCTERLRCC